MNCMYGGLHTREGNGAVRDYLPNNAEDTTIKANNANDTTPTT